MGFFSRLFNNGHGSDASVARRELLRVALRDTLNKHGIPLAWVGAETLMTASRDAHRGIHWRLLVKHWEPELLLHGVAFQQALVKRLTALDPKAESWLMGISWQFALPDESVCPPMPQRLGAASTPPAAAAVPARPVVAAQAAVPASNAKADLEQMLAARDQQFRREADEDPSPGFQRTEPAPLS